jgi:hypothetical protein
MTVDNLLISRISSKLAAIIFSIQSLQNKHLYKGLISDPNLLARGLLISAGNKYNIFPCDGKHNIEHFDKIFDDILAICTKMSGGNFPWKITIISLTVV